MPATCARCGAQNPDGNLYCQNCGNQLAAPAPGGVTTAVAPGAIPGPPPGPPPGFPAPVLGPGGYQSPYYTPAAPVAPVHRTPWTMIIAGVVALVLVMAGVGTALALLGGHKNTNASSSSSSSGLGSALSSPSPGGTPPPVASPVSTSGATETTDGFTLNLPAGWTVVSSNSETMVVSDPDGSGSVLVASGTSSPAQTALENKGQIDSYFKSNYPDAQTCPNTTAANTTFNGASGISWVLCFTVTAGGHSVPGTASLFAGANGSGSVYYLVMVVTRQGNLASYLNVAKPVLQSVHWKLG